MAPCKHLSVPVNDRQKSQGCLDFRLVSFEKEIIINSFVFSFHNDHSGLLHLYYCFPSHIGWNPIQDHIYGNTYLGCFHHMDSPCEHTIRSEKADPPHHRCCHSCESLQPSWEERGCEHAENIQKRKNKMSLSPHIFSHLTVMLS